jgi:hypothetical protein
MSLSHVNLIVTIDVEEDTWGSFSAANPTVENIKMIPILQNLFDSYGIKPTYLVTYPVASSSWAVGILSEVMHSGKCEIGAHLHPWNTPPLTEVVNERNSMLKNLPYELQSAKLKALTDKIESAFGTRPRSFRAGRWGLGCETVKTLIENGYVADTSVTPTISWANYGDGPEFPDVKTKPYWLSTDGGTRTDSSGRSIVEVPATIGFNRWPFEFWQKVYMVLHNERLKFLHPAGIAHRIGLLRKIWFSPEESSARDMITLARVMITNGAQILNCSFHSNSLLPGKGPFVRNAKELEDFYARIEKIFQYLSIHTRLRSLTLSDVSRLFNESEVHRDGGASAPPLKDTSAAASLIR